MTKPVSFGKIAVEVVASTARTRGKPGAETPFRIALLGDFSGRANRGISETSLSGRRPLMIDRDTIDGVIKKLGVEISLPIFKDAPPVRIRFRELDDFHPDHLFESLEVFQALKDTREGLLDPSTFEAIAAQFKGNGKVSEPSSAPQELDGASPEIPVESTGNLLDQVLEETDEKQPEDQSSRGSSEWDRFIQHLVEPHTVPDIETQQNKMVAAVDAAIGELMRMVLHHPDYQALESAWRGLSFLVSRLETDEQLGLHLIDLSKDELASNLTATDDLQSTDLYRLLVEETVETFGGTPWAVLAGNYTFDNSREDAELFGRMGKIARAAGAPFIAAASDTLLGCASLAHRPDPRDWNSIDDSEGSTVWEALRKLPEASYLALAIPRFLLRLPYGADTEPAERFDFEEMEEKPEHGHFLWGNPSLACACLFGQAFSEAGWDLRPGSIQEIEGLPLHVYKDEVESEITPCAEVVLSERAAEAILDKGLIPLLSFKNQDTARLVRFQSIVDPPTHLSGRWGKG